MTWTITTDQDGDLTASREPPAPTRTRGGTLDLVFKFTSQSDYNTMQRYLNYVGNVVTGVELDGDPYYRELQSDAKSMLMQFTPNSSISTVEGMWGVVTEGSIDSTLPPADLTVELTVFYLAESTDYASHSDVRAAFEV